MEKTKEKDRPVAEQDRRAPEVEVVQPAALERLGITSSAEIEEEVSLIDQLSRMEDAAVLFQRRVELIAEVRRSALAATQPDDWVLFKDKGGNITGMLCRSGAEKVADYYGVQVRNFRPLRGGIFEPAVERGDDGEIRFKGWCDAKSLVTGREIESVEFGRASSEDFTGRGAVKSTSDLVRLADLRASTYTAGRVKAVRIICGMSRVPAAELEGAGIDLALCRKGAGYGTSTERGASRSADEGIGAKAAELAREVLARVGGDEEAARGLMKEITANPPKFDGFDSARRLTKDWQVENAWGKLRAHETFGDAAAEGGAA